MNPQRLSSTRLSSLALPLVLLVAALLVAGPALGERADDANRKSKNGATETTIGGVTVKLEYGRPQVKGRTIWGNLVPYGKVWRTGADEATTITLSGDVTIEGQSLAAGTYSVFSIPGESEWTLIFNTVAEQWGAYEYAEGKDTLRVTVTPQAHEHVEAMDFVVDGDTIHLRWERLAVPFTIAAGG